MKNILLIFFTICTLNSFGQKKYDNVNFNKFIEIEGTEYVMASIESWTKRKGLINNDLLFIDTKTGQTNEIKFPKGSSIDKIEQIKMDSLAINKIFISARTIDLDGKKGIGWNEPKQLFIISTNGKEKTQLTDNNMFVNTWIINKQSGAIIIAGYYDTNKNDKHDKADRNEILIYNLKTLKLIRKI